MSPKASPTSHTYFSQRLRLHYLDWGNEGAPPLLMIHGHADHCHNWDWMAERLRDEYHIIAPDLRGHGDSEWSPGGNYGPSDFVYDIAQLVHQANLEQVRIVAHSLGGIVAVRYAGAFPEQVARLAVIDGFGAPPGWSPPPQSPQERLRHWVESARALAGRRPRRYASLDEAYERMQGANGHLSPAQARHLTIHGTNQNEDGTYSWKFDNYIHLSPLAEMSVEDVLVLQGNVACPVLMVSGAESWSSKDSAGLVAPFRDARHIIVEHAGHWVHHDQLDEVLGLVQPFLA